MRTLREECRFDRFGLAHWHGEDGAVQAAVRVPILNRNDVNLVAEKAQRCSAPERRKPRDLTHSSSNGTLTVSSGDDILYGSGGDFAGALGEGEGEGPVLHLQVSFGVLLDTRQTDDLHCLDRCRCRRCWLGVAD